MRAHRSSNALHQCFSVCHQLKYFHSKITNWTTTLKHIAWARTRFTVRLHLPAAAFRWSKWHWVNLGKHLISCKQKWIDMKWTILSWNGKLQMQKLSLLHSRSRYKNQRHQDRHSCIFYCNYHSSPSTPHISNQRVTLDHTLTSTVLIIRKHSL